MALNVGERLGHREVTAPIGEGGMGDVYRARELIFTAQIADNLFDGETKRFHVARARVVGRESDAR